MNETTPDPEFLTEACFLARGIIAELKRLEAFEPMGARQGEDGLVMSLMQWIPAFIGYVNERADFDALGEAICYFYEDTVASVIAGSLRTATAKNVSRADFERWFKESGFPVQSETL